MAESDASKKKGAEYDTELYDSKDKFSGYVDEIDVDDNDEDNDDVNARALQQKKEKRIKAAQREVPQMEDEEAEPEVRREPVADNTGTAMYVCAFL